jgi:hypothetical protein
MGNLAHEPIAGAALTFGDGTRLAYQAGSPGRWLEERPDGTGAVGLIHAEDLDAIELSDIDPGSNFADFIRRVTRFAVKNGRVVDELGKAVPETVASRILRDYRARRTNKESRNAKSAPGRRFSRRDCFLISSDRLAAPQFRSIARDARSEALFLWDGPRGSLRTRMHENESDVVADIAIDFRDRIRDARQESSRRSWQLDGSFIQRALATVQADSPLTAVERATLVGQVSELQSRMVRCALAGSSAEIPASSSDSPDVKKILDLYLRDLREKAESSLSVLPKLELFEEILNSHFTDKVTKFSAEDGLSVIRRGSGQEIPLERLSSGERHLIVLFHHLIFKTKPGGLCLIDEPEISLHVDWQERFIDSVSEVAKVSPQQFLIATHSPSIVGKHYELMRDVCGDSSK